jgi:hypothetical protein
MQHRILKLPQDRDLSAANEVTDAFAETKNAAQSQ